VATFEHTFEVKLSLTQTKFKPFLGILGRQILTFATVAFYMKGLVSPCSKMSCDGMDDDF
jgi:hypothetical protein